MEFFEELVDEMELSRIQANKMTNMVWDILKDTLREEQQVKMALNMTS